MPGIGAVPLSGRHRYYKYIREVFYSVDLFTREAQPTMAGIGAVPLSGMRSSQQASGGSVGGPRLA